MTDFTAPRAMLDAVELPAGTHARLLTDTDWSNSLRLEGRVVVWADLPYTRCPGCDQPVDQDRADACPVMFDGGAAGGPEVKDLRPQCGCGWNHPHMCETVHTPEGAEDAEQVGPDDVRAAARRVADDLAERREQQRATTLRRLRGELDDAMAALREPLRPGETREQRRDEVATGSPLEPGVYHSGDEWVAWDHHPDRVGDILSVQQEDQ